MKALPRCLALVLALVASRPAMAAREVVAVVELASDDAGMNLADLRELVAIVPGEPLESAAVRRTLTNLYAAGRAREIEISSRESAAGLVVRISLWSEILVREVKLVGDLGLKRRELLAVLERGEGQPLVESRILRGVYALTELYQGRGYYEAKVRVRVEDLAPRAVRVVYEVSSGPLAKVAEVEISGDLGALPATDLAARFPLRSGDAYGRRVLDQALEKLRANLLAEDYRAARVGLPIERYDAAADAVFLTIPVSVGPRVSTQIVGADLETLKKKGLLPFLGPDGYDEALVDQAVEKIRATYQQQGHYQVAVVPTLVDEGDRVEVQIAVAPGPRFAVKAVRFEGNTSVAPEKLAPLLATAPASWFSVGGGRLISETLEADRANLEAYYRLNGFVEAAVAAPRVEIEGEHLVVVFAVTEGRQRRVGNLTFEGFNTQSVEQLGRELGALLPPLAEGEPFHPLRLERALDWLRAQYERDGYAEARVTVAEDWNPDGTAVDLRFTAVEGEPMRVDRVIVRGHTRTSSALVMRAMGLKSGDLISRARLLDAERSLYQLGVFSQVAVDFAPADPGSLERDVVAQVQEGQTHRLVYGVGYDSEDKARALLGYTSSNLFGRGYTLGADMRLSGLGDSEQGSRFRLTFDQPFVGRFNIPLTYTLFSLDEARPTFRVERDGARVEAVKELGGGDDRFSLVLDYRVVKPDRDIGERDDRSISISSVTPTIFLDARDDPVNPSRGRSFLGQLQYAARIPALGTDESFIKAFVQGTGIFPLGRLGVLAGSLRLGAIEPLREEVLDPVLDPALANSRVSIAERFFLGGTTTHRAFAQDELGLPGRTLLFDPEPETLGRLLPQGGNGLALLNLDWRFPLAGGLGGVLFFDAGNVWADWRDFDPAEARLGVGFALRYVTPIGPLQLGIAFKLDDAGFDEDGQELVILLGNPF